MFTEQSSSPIEAFVLRGCRMRHILNAAKHGSLEHGSPDMKHKACVKAYGV